MKVFTHIFVLLISLSSFSQNILIPYRNGDKFGLSDEKGKMVLQPSFDELEWIKDNYIQFTKAGNFVDTFRYEKRMVIERREKEYGLLINDRVLIPGQMYPSFFVFDHLIAAAESGIGENPIDCIIYNKKGKIIYDDVIRRLYVNSSYTGSLSRFTDKYSLLTMMHKEESSESKFWSIAVWDNTTEHITQWLFKKVMDLKVLEEPGDANWILYSFKDNGISNEKYVRIVKGKFEVIDAKTLSDTERKKIEITEAVYLKNKKEDADDQVYSTEEMMKESMDDLMNQSYTARNGILTFIESGKKTEVPVSADSKLFYKEYEFSPVIRHVFYRKDNKFGFIKGGVVQKAEFDSLLFFGDKFIAGKKIAGKLQFGVIDINYKEYLPFIYDSIIGGLQRLDKKPNFRNTPTTYSLELRNIESSYFMTKNEGYEKRYVTNIVVCKGGKKGIVNEYNQLLVPIEYDMIAKNTLLLNIGKEVSDFVIMKKDGKYGVATFMSPLSEEIQISITPHFSYMPFFYWKDYFGKKGFDLYGLCGEDFELKGYAGEDGKAYFENFPR
jgi:hypothetical protein